MLIVLRDEALIKKTIIIYAKTNRPIQIGKDKIGFIIAPIVGIDDEKYEEKEKKHETKKQIKHMAMTKSDNPEKEYYLCNQAITPTDAKLVHSWDKVTCKNCLNLGKRG